MPPLGEGEHNSGGPFLLFWGPVIRQPPPANPFSEPLILRESDFPSPNPSTPNPLLARALELFAGILTWLCPMDSEPFPSIHGFDPPSTTKPPKIIAPD